MPHVARKGSESGYYHVVAKGVHSQILFEDDGDRTLYVDLLDKSKRRSGVLIHAYCLMSNHVHLVLEDPRGELASFMKYVDERYGTHFSERTGRLGGVFVRPFWSEPIESDAYLLSAVRYVHANPSTAGICAASAYEWSSVKDYLGRKGITDTGAVLDMLGGRDGFVEWSQAANGTALAFPDSRLKGHLSDDEVARVVRAIVGRDDINLSSLCADERRMLLGMLAERGFSVRQLSRVVGLSRSEISKGFEP